MKAVSPRSVRSYSHLGEIKDISVRGSWQGLSTASGFRFPIRRAARGEHCGGRLLQHWGHSPQHHPWGSCHCWAAAVGWQRASIPAPLQGCSAPAVLAWLRNPSRAVLQGELSTQQWPKCWGGVKHGLGVSVCSGGAGSLCWGALLWEELKQSSDARAEVHSGVGLVPMGGLSSPGCSMQCVGHSSAKEL